MAHSSSNSVQYTQFPTYRRSLLFRPSMTHSFTESDLGHSSTQAGHPFQTQSKRKPTLLHPSLQRTPLKPCLSSQSSTPSSISRQSKIKDSESRLRKQLSDLESRLDDLQFSRAAIKSSSPSTSLSSLFLPQPSRKPSTPSVGPSPESKQPRFDNQILGIFLKNNGGYLDDSDSSDDEGDASHQPPRLSYHPASLSPLAGKTKQKITASSHNDHATKPRSPRQKPVKDAPQRRSLSMNVL
ncbi:hypothetical protein PTTG_04309 [Puccinia triticina 1-1 BBBD Race 1]|uniref:Uncharacterized protein n=1 Tax=Puccinia triticina (isolate 1-1 / race 1 (BBBD)) TaxID=630390 RepID=A0A0C4EU30_PUCT1|nr:hypothetical protein PTTG_04309 [Puccinia triticina 1-1 BBBD Race 1]